MLITVIDGVHVCSSFLVQWMSDCTYIRAALFVQTFNDTCI